MSQETKKEIGKFMADLTQAENLELIQDMLFNVQYMVIKEGKKPGKNWNKIEYYDKTINSIIFDLERIKNEDWEDYPDEYPEEYINSCRNK